MKNDEDASKQPQVVEEVTVGQLLQYIKASMSEYQLCDRSINYTASELIAKNLMRQYPNGLKIIPASPPSGWYKIETAPRDGTAILLYGPQLTHAVTGFFSEGKWFAHHSVLDTEFSPTHWKHLDSPQTEDK